MGLVIYVHYDFLWVAKYHTHPKGFLILSLLTHLCINLINMIKTSPSKSVSLRFFCLLHGLHLNPPHQPLSAFQICGGKWLQDCQTRRHPKSRYSHKNLCSILTVWPLTILTTMERVLWDSPEVSTADVATSVSTVQTVWTTN